MAIAGKGEVLVRPIADSPGERNGREGCRESVAAGDAAHEQARQRVTVRRVDRVGRRHRELELVHAVLRVQLLDGEPGDSGSGVDILDEVLPGENPREAVRDPGGLNRRAVGMDEHELEFVTDERGDSLLLQRCNDATQEPPGASRMRRTVLVEELRGTPRGAIADGADGTEIEMQA